MLNVIYTLKVYQSYTMNRFLNIQLYHLTIGLVIEFEVLKIIL